jgi:hypothetical protein
MSHFRELACRNFEKMKLFLIFYKIKIFLVRIHWVFKFRYEAPFFNKNYYMNCNSLVPLFTYSVFTFTCIAIKNIPQAV